MFYLLCFRKNEFSCRELGDRKIAENLAENLISHDFYDRIILTEGLAECFVEEEDDECPVK